MTQEPITFYVQDVVARTGIVLRDVAKLGYETLLMAKAAHAEEWAERDEAQLQMLCALADGKFITLRDSEARERQTAENYLRQFGGSKKGMERGLTSLAMLKEKA